ncbi:MAG: enolase C-terminal domain-like protein [Alphaproteobacteria bacterium]|nr:enolase C-terminal domain-like protein [Alphaproteobacteria bacterium]
MADVIEKLETYCLELPYAQVVHFHSVTEDRGRYLIVRLVSSSGAEGIAESVCRPEQTGDTPDELAADVAKHLEPLVLGADPTDDGVFDAVWGSAAPVAAKGIVDVALWDLKGKILDTPAWRLLGPGPAEPVPVAWIVHGNTVEEQVAEAIKAIDVRGFSALKLKTWKKSMDDVDMVRAVREAVGPDRIIWCDANGSYTPDEARAVFPHLAELGVSFIEDPCTYDDLDAVIALARDLPIPVLGDKPCQGFAEAQHLIESGAAGAVSVKLRRTGVTEGLRIIRLAEEAGVPVVIGTDSESRIGSLSRIHLRAANPSMAPWPTETHFFGKLAEDVFVGDFVFENGCITATGTAGFGAGLDMTKLMKMAA